MTLVPAIRPVTIYPASGAGFAGFVWRAGQPPHMRVGQRWFTAKEIGAFRRAASDGGFQICWLHTGLAVIVPQSLEWELAVYTERLTSAFAADRLDCEIQPAYNPGVDGIPCAQIVTAHMGPYDIKGMRGTIDLDLRTVTDWPLPSDDQLAAWARAGLKLYGCGEIVEVGVRDGIVRLITNKLDQSMLMLPATGALDGIATGFTGRSTEADDPQLILVPVAT